MGTIVYNDPLVLKNLFRQPGTGDYGGPLSLFFSSLFLGFHNHNNEMFSFQR